MHTLQPSPAQSAAATAATTAQPLCRVLLRDQRQRVLQRAPSALRALPADDDDAAPGEQTFGDWRAFRAQLIMQEDKQQQQQRRLSEDNQVLLEMQDPKLAAEEVWAHATAQPERGGLLLATPDGPGILGSNMLSQAVVLVVQHSPVDGSVGLILNRPTNMVLRPGRGGLRYAVVGAPDDMQGVFGDNRVYCGGDVRQDVIHLLHGHNLEGAVEIVPGVYHGGERAAVKAVQDGLVSPEAFKFFAGALVWEGNALQQEVDKGVWWTAAASRPLVLKQVLQLPRPLWKEVLDAMGGEFAEVAREDIIE